MSIGGSGEPIPWKLGLPKMRFLDILTIHRPLRPLYIIYICMYIGLWMVKISEKSHFRRPNFHCIGSPESPIDIWVWCWWTKLLPWSYLRCYLSTKVWVSIQNLDLEGVGSARLTFPRAKKALIFSILGLLTPLSTFDFGVDGLNWSPGVTLQVTFQQKFGCLFKILI